MTTGDRSNDLAREADAEGALAPPRSVRVRLVRDLEVGGLTLPAGQVIGASVAQAGRMIGDGQAEPIGPSVETAAGPPARERAVGLRGQEV